MYRSPAGLKIMLLATLPNLNDHARVTWTMRHNPGTTGQNPVATTVPDADFEAVCDCAAALCLESLAAKFIQVGDSTMGADAVNYRTKAQEYQSLAKSLRKRYDDHVGIQEGAAGGTGSGQAAAISVGSMFENMGPGVPRLTHRRPRSLNTFASAAPPESA